MKKIISILVVALITLLSIGNVSAFGTFFESDTLKINGKEIGTWKQIYIEGVVENVVYFGARKVDEDRKYYKYEKSKLIEIKENEIKNTDYSDRDNWTVNKHYKEARDTDSNKITIIVDGKNYGPYNSDFYQNYELGNNTFYFSYVDDTAKNFINLFTYSNSKQEIKKEIKPIPKIDKVLNKFFAKIDKRGETKAKVLYKKIIKKIDSIISKTKSAKKKELLRYIKVKFEEKVK